MPVHNIDLVRQLCSGQYRDVLRVVVPSVFVDNNDFSGPWPIRLYRVPLPGTRVAGRERGGRVSAFEDATSNPRSASKPSRNDHFFFPFSAQSLRHST